MKRTRSTKLASQSESTHALHLVTARPQTPPIEGMVLPATVLGRIVLVESPRSVLVDFAAGPPGCLIAARSLVLLSNQDTGHEVALTFVDGDPLRPIVLGLLEREKESSGDTLHATLDGDSVCLTAKKEIVLRCGKASITLTSAGKLLIEGEYVVSRSAGVNKIRGGSVQIN